MSSSLGRLKSMGVSVLLVCACQSDGSSRSDSESELSSQGLPLEDVTCEVHEQDGSRQTYEYEPATRTLTSDKLFITFDDAGRYLRRGDPSGEWLHEHSYDEHGQHTKFVYSWMGTVHPGNSSDYTPKYELDRLSEVSFTSGDGQSSGRTVFSYEAGRVSRETTTSLRGGAARDFEIVFRYDAQGRVAEVEQGVELTTFGYDKAGRLISASQDGFAWAAQQPDGKPEIEQRWYYDEAGTLYRYTVDGTTSNDNPVVDGQLDVDRRFSPDCTALLVLGRDEIFRLPRAPGSY